MKSSVKTIVVTACCTLLLSGAARASLIWDGNASNGTGVFKVLNLEDKNGNSEPNPKPERLIRHGRDGRF